MVFIAGLGRGAKIQLGAMGILFSTHALGFMMASGFGVAVATRVSNELGEGLVGIKGGLQEKACNLSRNIELRRDMPLPLLLLLLLHALLHIYASKGLPFSHAFDVQVQNSLQLL